MLGTRFEGLILAAVLKLVDKHGLGPCGVTHGGSSPLCGTLFLFRVIMKSKNVKLVVFVPLTHVDVVRQALGEVGAGKIGNYDFCSFSSRGVGRFRGNEKTNPTIGETGKYEAVEEEKIEVVVSRKILKEVVKK